MVTRNQIFIGSTFSDLKDEREKVMQTILSLDCIPVYLGPFSAMDKEQFEFIKRKIADCDYFLLIIGARYGSMDESGISYTEKEYDYAVSLGKPVFAFLHGEIESLPRNKFDADITLLPKLEAFRAKVETGRIVSYWENADDLNEKVAHSLYQAIRIEIETDDGSSNLDNQQDITQTPSEDKKDDLSVKKYAIWTIIKSVAQMGRNDGKLEIMLNGFIGLVCTSGYEFFKGFPQIQTGPSLWLFIISLIVSFVLVLKKNNRMNVDDQLITECKTILKVILNDNNKDKDFLSGQSDKDDINFDEIFNSIKTNEKKQKKPLFKRKSRIILCFVFFSILLTACQNNNTSNSMFEILTYVIFIMSSISLAISIYFGKNARLEQKRKNSDGLSPKNNNSPEYFIRRAEEYKNIGEIGRSNADYEQAVVLLQKSKSNELKVSQIMRLLANQYCETKEFDRAEYHFTNAISVLNEFDYQINPFALKELIKVLNDYGNMLVTCGKKDKAMDVFSNAFSLCQKYIGVAADDLSLKAMTLNNMAILHKLNNELVCALDKYNQALDIYRGLAKKDPELYQSYVASTLNNLSNLRSSINKHSEAEMEYKEALETYRQLAETNPETYLPNVAITLSNLAFLHRETHDYDVAVKEFQETLEIRRKLAANNPDAFLPDVAATLNNLANLHQSMHNYDAAAKEYQEALEIRRHLAADKPDAFLPDVATTLNNLANLHNDTHDYNTAVKEYQEALEIRRHLATDKPDTFLPDVATTLNNLANLHSDTHDYDAAVKEYQKALEIRRHLATDKPDTFLPDVAKTLFNIAILHIVQEQQSQAEEAVSESLKIFTQMAEKYPADFGQYKEKAQGLLDAIHKTMQ